jgi:serine/threonine-protein phosphatase PGAM5
LHVVHLIRHGQYLLDPELGDGPLTELGREQAQSAAQHLRRWPIAQIWASDLQRAVETAQIISDGLEIGQFKQTRLLREVLPTAVPGQRVPLPVRRAGRRALERVAEEFLQPVRSKRHDLLVCHGNLIRSLVCRVLNAPQASWLQLACQHCALTTIAIAADGSKKLLRYGETAYLDAALLTSH